MNAERALAPTKLECFPSSRRGFFFARVPVVMNSAVAPRTHFEPPTIVAHRCRSATALVPDAAQDRGHAPSRASRSGIRSGRTALSRNSRFSACVWTRAYHAVDILGVDFEHLVHVVRSMQIRRGGSELALQRVRVLLTRSRAPKLIAVHHSGYQAFRAITNRVRRLRRRHVVVCGRFAHAASYQRLPNRARDAPQLCWPAPAAPFAANVHPCFSPTHFPPALDDRGQMDK